MKRIAPILAIVALISFPSFAAEKHGKTEKEAEGTKTSLTGEVIDLQCYLGDPSGSMGPDHAKCAKSCILKGLPAGLLVDGKVYLLLGPEHESAKGSIANFAGKTVTVEGMLLERSGVKALQIASVKGGEEKPESGKKEKKEHHN